MSLQTSLDRIVKNINMYKVNNWEYKISYSANKMPILKITQDKEIPSPKTLSKYYSLNKNNVQAFVNSQFYVSHPEKLNDIFDFNLSLIDFTKYKFSDIEALLPDEEEKKEALNGFQNNAVEYLEKLKNTFYGLWISVFGILCMTEDKFNDLMWAHYTNNSGFLLEFNHDEFKKDIFVGPYPINYIPLLESLDFSVLEMTLGFFIVSLIKKSVWKYENEFRYFCLPDIKTNFKVDGRFSNSQFDFDLQERLISYPAGALKKVILGFNFFSNDIKETIGPHEYLLDFKDENALLKTQILDKIINDKLAVDICIFDKTDFSLKSIPISVNFKNGTLYSVKENRQLYTQV